MPSSGSCLKKSVFNVSVLLDILLLPASECNYRVSQKGRTLFVLIPLPMTYPYFWDIQCIYLSVVTFVVKLFERKLGFMWGLASIASGVRRECRFQNVNYTAVSLFTIEKQKVKSNFYTSQL